MMVMMMTRMVMMVMMVRVRVHVMSYYMLGGCHVIC